VSSLLERQLRETLADQPAPGELAAGRRSWPVIEAALSERPPVARRRRRPALRLALVAALLAAGLVAALSPAGAAVGDWIEERVGLGPHESQPTLDGFPAGGRLLVVSKSGAWVVSGGGGLRGLGRYSEVGWSPRGLFVIGTRGHRLTAMEPNGLPHWRLVRRGRLSNPAWSPGDGYRVAYLESADAITDLRVVDGRGQLDHKIAAAAARVTPAWRPRGGYVLTYARDAAPGVVTVDADTGSRLWKARTGAVPRELAWTRDGRRLVVLLPGALRVYGRAGRLQGELRFERGTRALALALHPSGRRAALAVAQGGSSRVLDIRLKGDPVVRRRLFTGPGTFSQLAWSPGGRRLLVAWPQANQWFLIGRDRPRAFARVSRQFGPGGGSAGFPRLSGWCCPR
jgi:hypothetical protein